MSDETMKWLQSYADYLRSTGVDLPAGWLPYSFDVSPEVCPAGFCRLTGSVPIGKKRDGSPRWPAKKYGQAYYVETAKCMAWREAQT